MVIQKKQGSSLKNIGKLGEVPSTNFGSTRKVREVPFEISENLGKFPEKCSKSQGSSLWMSVLAKVLMEVPFG